jgi:hypothetical protein
VSATYLLPLPSPPPISCSYFGLRYRKKTLTCLCHHLRLCLPVFRATMSDELSFEQFSFADVLPAPSPAKGSATQVTAPPMTVPKAAEVLLAVLTTFVVCDGEDEKAVCAFPAASALYKLVGPFTGPHADAAACQQREEKVRGTLRLLKDAVVHAASDASGIAELFGLLERGVGVPNSRSWCPVSSIVGDYTNVPENAMKAASRAFTDSVAGAEREGRRVEQVQKEVDFQQRALDTHPAPDSSATPKDKKAHRELVKEMQKNLDVQRRKLEATAQAQASYQQDAVNAAAERRSHFATAWAWRVLFGGALPYCAANKEGSGAGKGEDGGRPKRKNPFAAEL